MKIGIQLFSVRNNMMKDPLEAIRKVAEKGYRYLEVANHNALEDFGVGFPVSPKEINQVLKETGSEIVSAHVFPLEVDKMKPILDYHTEIGTKYIAVPMGFFPNKDAVLATGEMLNQVGEECAKAGIQLVYHNHFHEFQVLKGEEESVFDLMMKNTDPKLVQIEIDTYWALRGGVDPVAFIKKYGKRIPLIHQKDYPKGMESQLNLIDAVHEKNANVDMAYFGSVVDEKAFIEIGDGIMDIQGIIDAANEYSITEYLILEQDSTTHDEMDSIGISMENLKKFKGISWN